MSANTTARQACVWILLLALALLAALSMRYAVRTAFQDSADLERRAVEAKLFRQGRDPYLVPDMTYPPTAIPVFAALVPIGSKLVRQSIWIALNLASLGAFCGLVIITWGRNWPLWIRVAFTLAVVASKPVRAGIALGQFHLIPTALLVAAEALAARRVLAGAFVGIALAKPTMSLPYLAVLAARKRWLSCAVAFSFQLVLFGVVILWLRLGPMLLLQEWLANARSQSVFGTIDVPSVLGRAVPALGEHATLVTLVVLIMATIVIFVLRSRSSLGLLAISTFSAAVMTYHRHYDLVLLLPTLAYLVDTAVHSRRFIPLALATSFGMLLVVPSDDRFIGSQMASLYDALFMPACYVVLAALLIQVARESHTRVPLDSSPSS